MDSTLRADETIQLLYTVASQIFQNDATLDKRTIDIVFNVCEQSHKQFNKIKEALEIENQEEHKKRIREYADDGCLYLETCKKKYRHTYLPEPETQDLPETEDLPETQDLPEPPDLPEEAKKDGPSTSEYNEDLLPAASNPSVKNHLILILLKILKIHKR